MFDAEQIARTTQRYEARTSQRAGTEAKIEAGAILEADDPDRVRKRLARKGLAPETIAEVMSGDLALATAEIASPRALNVLERILGTDDLINATFLTAGARVSRAIGRVEIGERNGLVAGYGTGVMVSPRLLLTNNHVLESAAIAAVSQVEFGYEDDAEGRIQTATAFALDPDTLFVTDPALDYTLVAVQSPSATGQPVADFGWVPLIEQQGKVIKGEFVNIIQHPNGEPKRLALRENQIVDLLDDFLHYKTDTAPGSSGSPVFNDEWEMVALHHSGVPAKDADGNFLALDGSVWTPDLGEHRVKWVANEGARVSRLVRHLGQANLSDSQRRLLEEALAGQSPAPAPVPVEQRQGVVLQRPSPGAQTGNDAPTARTAPAVAGDTVTWTIPLQVSVRLGTPAAGMPPSAGSAAAIADHAAVTPPVSASTESDQLAEAMAELERGRTRPYYDQAEDDAARASYFRDLPAARPNAAFFTALTDLVTRTHTTKPRYAPSRHVYPWVDLRPNRMLRSIYTGEEYRPETFIQEDIRTQEAFATRMRERLGAEAALTAETLALLEALLPYNCEHVVPQSWFGEREPMRGDLHHLFACEAKCNSFRGNRAYFDFPQFEEAIREGCGMLEPNKFEPSHGKGAAARATFYFLVRYPGEINRSADEYELDRLPLLLTWHTDEPVDEYERHRNAAIFAKQGNRNPFIDFPEWATEVDFTAGLGDA